MTFPNLLTTDETADLEDRDELQAWRDGAGRIAEDPMHAGQPVHVAYRYDDGEPVYHLQRTHQGMPLWFCPVDLSLTIGGRDGSEPAQCAKCGIPDDLGAALYDEPAACRSWLANYGGQYDGACLIAGSDGCDCEGANGR